MSSEPAGCFPWRNQSSPAAAQLIWLLTASVATWKQPKLGKSPELMDTSNSSATQPRPRFRPLPHTWVQVVATGDGRSLAGRGPNMVWNCCFTTCCCVVVWRLPPTFPVTFACYPAKNESCKSVFIFLLAIRMFHPSTRWKQPVYSLINGASDGGAVTACSPEPGAHSNTMSSAFPHFLSTSNLENRCSNDSGECCASVEELIKNKNLDFWASVSIFAATNLPNNRHLLSVSSFRSGFPLRG